MFVSSTDQTGYSLILGAPPGRIVSLVPSQTELLFDLGLDENIVGLTRYCIHPAQQVKGKTIIGGTKQFNIEAIHALQPHLLIGNKEENYREGIEELRRHYPVWISDIYTLPDALHMMREVGRITNRSAQAHTLANTVQQRFAAIPTAPKPLRAAYLIWRKPYMVAADNTFIHHMLQVMGVSNVFENETRYPEITLPQLAAAAPDVILLSSEPYRFTHRHYSEFKEVCPQAIVQLVNGELFSWYGSRLLHTPAYLTQLRHELLSSIA